MRTLIARLSVFLCVICMSVSLLASSDDRSVSFDNDMLMAVGELYGLSEEQAVDRLVKEYDAALLYMRISDLSLDSYAGSWFDESSMKLKVAVSDPADLSQLDLFDVEPVLVEYSLADLKSKLAQATNMLSDSVIVISYVDIKSNKVVLGVEKSQTSKIQNALDGPENFEMVEVLEKNVPPVLSIGPFRAADEYRNEDFEEIAGRQWPCSIGAPIEEGFVTVGHCAFEGHIILDEDGDDFGEVQDSEWEDSTNGPDVAYVETLTDWTPLGEVNGYTDGNFDISAEWGGLVKYAIGSTVCRYGRTTGGPNCSTLDQLDVNVSGYPGNRTIVGLSVVDESCTSDGDSGGTWVAGTGQIQGIHVGGQPVNDGDQCPTTFEELYFQPIRDALDEYDVTMLTSHGSSAPSITSVSCPNMAISGQGLYQCLVKKVDSQGEVGIQWITSTGASSTGLWVMDNCTSLQMVTVTLKATNPYGTTTKNYSFRCPSGPIE